MQADIHDLTYGDWVKKVTDQASKDGVTGTPTVFVDGTKLADISADRADRRGDRGPGGLTRRLWP